MSHFIKWTALTVYVSYIVPKLIFSRGKGGGDSKRGAYLKLGANSSIYGTQHNGATPDSGRKIKEQEDIS